MDGNTALSPLDKRVLDLYREHKTLAEISSETGLDEQDVYRQIDELIHQRDFLGVQREIALSLMMLREIAEDGRQRTKNASNKDFAPMVNAIRNASEAVFAEIRKQQNENKVTDQEMRDAFSRQFAQMISDAYQRLLGKLQERYPDVEQADLKSDFDAQIKAIAKEHDEGYL